MRGGRGGFSQRGGDRGSSRFSGSHRGYSGGDRDNYREGNSRFN